MRPISKTTWSAAWVLVGISALANAAGYLFGLWSALPWFDEVVHLFSSFAVTLLVACFLAGRVLTGAGPQSAIKGKFDTIMDLLLDTLGGLGAAIWAAADARRRR